MELLNAKWAVHFHLKITDREKAIKLRIDVDYPYPSRAKSFLFTPLNSRPNRNYLKNAKIIAKMINETTRKVSAYWFFTTQTIPDKEMLDLLSSDKHEVALHVTNNPYEELELLEKATKRKINSDLQRQQVG